jgi:DeoR/GlpR family transcriptional regulator of sugar metabolism
LIEKNKQITTKEISEKLGVSLSTVKRKLNVLKQNSNLERIGSDKTGYWRIKIK